MAKKKKCIDSQASVNCDHIDKFYCHFENGGLTQFKRQRLISLPVQIL